MVWFSCFLENFLQRAPQDICFPSFNLREEPSYSNLNQLSLQVQRSFDCIPLFRISLLGEGYSQDF